MASDGDRLRAERLYIEAGESAVRRVAFCRTLSRNVAADAVVEQVAAHRILSRAEGLAILAEIALDRNLEPRDRTNAVKAAAAIDAWTVTPSSGPVADVGVTVVPEDSDDWIQEAQRGRA